MRYAKTMSEALADVREGFSKKEIKMAIGIASDPRYKGGNYTGAFNAIEKIKKGLAKHPQVAAVLKRQNEEIVEKYKCPKCEGKGCDHCDGKGYHTEGLDKEDEPFVKDLIQKLRGGSKTHAKQADDLEKAMKEDGHADVSSAIRQCKTITEDATEIDGKLQTMSPEDNLPTWWTNKLAVASNSMNKMRDYIVNPIQEETELDENASKAFDRIIKDGGIDKKDFQKAKQLYMKKDLTGLRKHIYNLDTSPLEAIMDVIAKNDPKAFMKMYPKSKEGEYMSSIAHAHKEEVELDEGKMKDLSMKIDSITAKMKKDKRMKSFADKFKKDAMKSMDIKKSLEKVLPDYIAGKDIQALVKEAFVTLFTTELDEAKEVLSRFKDDKLKKSIMNLATQKGLKVKEMGDKLEVSGNARKVMDLTLAVQKHDVKIEHNMMSAYTAAITKGVK